MSKLEAVTSVPRVLKINTSPSLSGRSQITYHIGCNADGAIQFRIVQNSSSGCFNGNWVSLAMVEKLLSELPISKPLSAAVLRPAYLGQSSNSPAFLASALLAESILLPGSDKENGYQRGDIEAFKKAMSDLIASGTSLNTPVEVAEAPDTPRRRKPKEAK